MLHRWGRTCIIIAVSCPVSLGQRMGVQCKVGCASVIAWCNKCVKLLWNKEKKYHNTTIGQCELITYIISTPRYISLIYWTYRLKNIFSGVSLQPMCWPHTKEVTLPAEEKGCELVTIYLLKDPLVARSGQGGVRRLSRVARIRF